MIEVANGPLTGRGDLASHNVDFRMAAHSTEGLVVQYLRMKRDVIEAGFDHELILSCQAASAATTPRILLREASWVILSTGLSNSVVARIFPLVASRMMSFDVTWIVDNQASVREDVLEVFGHERKVDAILQIAEIARRLGGRGIRAELISPEHFLTSLPYIGPVTWRHLAKNLGCAVVKPDRHLVRLAQLLGRTVDDMCGDISAMVGDPLPMVDSVLWRWLVTHPTKRA